MAGGSLVTTWQNSYSRDPVVIGGNGQGLPPWAPLATELTGGNAAGNWLFCLVSWRQDGGFTGEVAYPSSVSVADDAGNFWLPVSVSPSAGVVRCSAWMAPAARPCQWVTVSPCPVAAQMPYQAGLFVTIAEFTADCPWYEIAISGAFTYENQGTSLSATFGPASGVFGLVVAAWDALPGVTVTPTGLTALTTGDTTNGTDATGTIAQDTWYATGTGSTLGVSLSWTGAMDAAILLVAVQGVTNPIAYPYSLQPQNWPALLTEMASGPVLNADPVIAQGTTYWNVQDGTITPVTWPQFAPWPAYADVLSGSLLVVPSGSATFVQAFSEQEPVSPTVLYSALAWVYSPGGWSSTGLQVIIFWYTSGGSFISQSNGTVTAVAAGEWTQLTVTSAAPPANAALAAVGVAEVSGSDVPSSAVFYVGYCGFGPASGYGNTPPDQTQWTDFSSRSFSMESLSAGRGIQYEQQSLEAGTCSVALDDHDAALTFGNILATYWPEAGDCDIQIRVRAVWPWSVTPYAVLFSGYTDQVELTWNRETWYGYLKVTAADVWSRLTAQTIGLYPQEVLQDLPWGAWRCSDSGANLVNGATTALASLTSVVGAGTGTATFSGSGIALNGDQGADCWQVSGVATGAGEGYQGVALTCFPADPSVLPPVADGVTLDWWWCPTETSGNQPTADLTVCTCWAGRGPMWTIWIGNLSGSGSSTANITVYNKAGRAATTTSLGSTLYLTTAHSAQAWYFSVTFDQSSLTVTTQPSTTTQTVTTVSCSLDSAMTGFSLAGNASPYGYFANPDGTPGFCNMAVYGVGLYPYQLNAARMTDHYLAGLPAFVNESDTARIARLTGYSGFSPPFSMRCLDLAVPPAPDVDIVTQASDTNGQVVSSYLTNIASSTLAQMYVSGPGVLSYRRRLESYDRGTGQRALGEDDPLSLSLGLNPLSLSPSVTGWSATNGATLATSSLLSMAPYFYPYCAVFHGNGSTANPQIGAGSLTATPVTPGQWYDASALVASTAGWATGVRAFIAWFTSGGSQISTGTGPLTALAAGGLAYASTGAQQAPATAAYAQMFVMASGTPASSALFYVASAILAQVNATVAGNPPVTAAEVPYMPGAKLSADRAQLFNYAIINQYGTGTNTTYQGSSLYFEPTSGVQVTAENSASVLNRGQVPYTATVYLDNTVQALPYYLNEGSIEDYASWVVETQASPALRPETVTIIPVATTGAPVSDVAAMELALHAQIGDVVTYHRRPPGSPAIRIVCYVSKISHEIRVNSDRPWSVRLELTPQPAAQALTCDDPLHGTLTGGNCLGW